MNTESEDRITGDAVVGNQNSPIRTSATIGQIAPAIAKMQASLTAAHFDSENPYFKSRYASLASIMAVARGPLGQNGLSVVQFPVMDGGVGCCTRIIHSSGEWIEGGGSLKFPTNKDDAHGRQGAFTYARRNGLAAALGIVADEDNDGNEAVAPPKQQASRKKPARKMADQSPKEMLVKKCLEGGFRDGHAFMDAAHQMDLVDRVIFPGWGDLDQETCENILKSWDGFLAQWKAHVNEQEAQGPPEQS